MKWKIAVALIVMVIFGGLDNYRELNDLAIVSSIGIDKDEEGKYIVSAQIMNSKKEVSGTVGNSSASSITVYMEEAETIQEALRDMINESPKRLYMAHMSMLVISEDIAKEGIGECLDFFVRDNEASMKVLMVIARKGTKAIDVLKVQTPIENNPTKNLIESISATFKYKGTTVKTILNEAIATMLEESHDLTIASCEMKGNVEDGDEKKSLEQSMQETRILVSNTAYFKSGKLAGYMSEDDTQSYNLLRNKIVNSIYSEKIDDKKIVLEVVDAKSNIKPKFENNNFTVDINIETTLSITEKDSSINSNTSKEIKEIEKRIEILLKKKVETYLYNTQNIYESDISGFGNMFYKYLPKEYLKVKDVFYDEYFKNIKFNVNFICDLESEGGVVKKW